MSNVLIIDDDAAICRMLELMVRQLGHEAHSTQTLNQGMAVVSKNAFDLVLLDVNLPDGNGLDLIEQINQSPSNPEVIIMTGQEDPDGAALAIEHGAWDYLPKTIPRKALNLSMLRVLEYKSSQKAQRIQNPIQRERIIGSSKALQQVLNQAAETVGSDGGVLITGETGTGKELFAQAVHLNSHQAKGNFVVVDCASLPPTLVESMLFGHVKGAFTGADTPREGLIKQADGGTLFLDEVGEMPLDLQKAFLRVLETHRFRPIGGKQEITSNFRVVSSTNCDLDEMVHQGQFRKDLLFRLRTFHLKLPSLRDRKEDIEALAEFHCQRICELYGRPLKTISQDFIDIMRAYDWPGNIRELVNTMDRSVSAAKDEEILYSCHIPKQLRASVARNKLSTKNTNEQSTVIHIISSGGTFPALQNYRETIVDKAETQYLHALISTSKGNISKACSLSGISRSRLYELLKKHDIPTS